MSQWRISRLITRTIVSSGDGRRVEVSGEEHEQIAGVIWTALEIGEWKKEMMEREGNS